MVKHDVEEILADVEYVYHGHDLLRCFQDSGHSSPASVPLTMAEYDGSL